MHRSTADGQKERKTERCRLTQARLETTGDKLTSVTEPITQGRQISGRFGHPRRERGDRTSILPRCLSFGSLTTDAIVWIETLYVRDVISVFLQYRDFRISI